MYFVHSTLFNRMENDGKLRDLIHNSEPWPEPLLKSWNEVKADDLCASC